MKKKILLTGIIISTLLVCYLLWENVVGPNRLVASGDIDNIDIAIEHEETFKLNNVKGMVSNAQFTVEIIDDAPILKRGLTNEFDSVDLLNPSIVNYNDMLYNYYSGFDGSVWRTGLAISKTGDEWIKKGIVLDLSEDKWDEEYIVANGSALQFNNKIYYFYQGHDDTSKIGLAISDNGENFVKTERPILLHGMILE